MADVFIIKLILSFIVGGLWVVVATVLAEKFGTKVGGFIVGLPGTAALALFFIGWSQSSEVAVQATTVVPFVGAVNTWFVVIYIWVLRRGFRVALLSALVFWTVMSLGLLKSKIDNFPLALLLYGMSVVAAYLVLEKRLLVQSQVGKKSRTGVVIILLRALFSGAVISLAVFLGKIGGPVFGGLFAMFPAVFLSTILITYLTHGATFSSATMKASVLTAVSIIVYTIVVRLVYVPLGIWLGTLVAYVVSFVTGGTIYFLARKYLL